MRVAAKAPENVATIGNATDRLDRASSSSRQWARITTLHFRVVQGPGVIAFRQGYLDQKGVIRGSDTRRFSGSVNYDQRLFADRLKHPREPEGCHARTTNSTPGGVVGHRLRLRADAASERCVGCGLLPMGGSPWPGQSDWGLRTSTQMTAGRSEASATSKRSIRCRSSRTFLEPETWI